jgi:hypothetical protein
VLEVLRNTAYGQLRRAKFALRDKLRARSPARARFDLG